MNPIMLPTSPETRAALEKTGFILLKERPHFEEWRTKDEANAIGLFQGTTPAIHGDWEALAPALVVLGITIPGYRIIPEETAQRAAGCARMKGANFYDVPLVRDRAYQDAETLWPSAAPHQTPIQDQAPALQAERGPAVPGIETDPPAPVAPAQADRGPGWPSSEPAPPQSEPHPPARAEGRPVSFPDAPLPKPSPSEEGGPSPFEMAEPTDEQLRMYSEIISRERGFHQVNPINQRAGAEPREED